MSPLITLSKISYSQYHHSVSALKIYVSNFSVKVMLNQKKGRNFAIDEVLHPSNRLNSFNTITLDRFPAFRNEGLPRQFRELLTSIQRLSVSASLLQFAGVGLDDGVAISTSPVQ